MNYIYLTNINHKDEIKASIPVYETFSAHIFDVVVKVPEDSKCEISDDVVYTVPNDFYETFMAVEKKAEELVQLENQYGYTVERDMKNNKKQKRQYWLDYFSCKGCLFSAIAGGYITLKEAEEKLEKLKDSFLWISNQ